jgi:hypothetical protein
MSEEDAAAMERAGITAPDGSLGRDVPTGILVVPPKPVVEGDDLVWRTAEPSAGPFWLAVPNRALLTAFVQLFDAPPGQVAGFAGRWGLLQLRDYGDLLPDQRVLVPNFPRTTTEGIGFTVTQAWPTDGLRESIKSWREQSKTARAMLSIAAALHEDDYGRLEDWLTLYPWVPAEETHWTHVRGLPTPKEALSLGWARLRDRLSQWLRAADVRPEISVVRAGRPEFMLTGRGVFGAVAIQLMFAICRSAGLAVCSECGAPYARPRRAARSRRNFCDSCRARGAAVRAARRDTDTRKREAVRLAGKGLSPQAIAESLARPLKTIRGWLSKHRMAQGKTPSPGRKEARRSKPPI